MATGNFVAGTVQHDGVTVRAAILVAEGGSVGNVEYLVETPLRDAAGQVKAAATIKAELVAAATAKRSAQLATPNVVAGVSGSVTV